MDVTLKTASRIKNQPHLCLLFVEIYLSVLGDFNPHPFFDMLFHPVNGLKWLLKYKYKEKIRSL